MHEAVERELAELIRAGGQEPKGLLCTKILVPEAALADASGAELVQATVDFVNWAMSEAQLLPTEFPSEAFCAYYADYYLAQVNNGGHSQWAGNSGYNELVVKCAGWALEAMGASEYLAIHRDFVRLMEDDEAASKIMEGGGFGERVPAEDELNSRFYKLAPDFDYPMLKLSAAWLRSLPCLEPLAPEVLAAARAAVIAANPYRAERQQAAQRGLEKQVLYWVPRKLCADAGVVLDRLTAGDMAQINGKRQFAWYMLTDRGLMLAAFSKGSFFGGPTARLYSTSGAMRPVQGKHIAETSISKADYEAAVPREYR